MQAGGLLQVNEATNIFFMILRDRFISENAINLSPNRRYTFDDKKISANQNADTANFIIVHEKHRTNFISPLYTARKYIYI